MTRQRLFRAAVVLGLVAVVWTIVVLWVDGFVFHLGGIRISSRSPRNPALLVLLSLAVAWVLAFLGGRISAVLFSVATPGPTFSSIPVSSPRRCRWCC